MGFKGVDIRQSGDRIIFRASLKDSSGVAVTTGTTTLAIYELQSDGTLKSYDFNDNTFKSTALTTATGSMTHRTGNNGTVSTGIWTYVLSTLTGFTRGNIYFAVVTNSGASPAAQEREFQFGEGEGDFAVDTSGRIDIGKLLGTAISTPATAGVMDVNAKAINNVATTNVTTINANIGMTQPINFTGTGASAFVKVDVKQWAAGAVNAAVSGIPYVEVNRWGGVAVSVDAGSSLPKVYAADLAAIDGSATAAAQLQLWLDDCFISDNQDGVKIPRVGWSASYGTPGDVPTMYGFGSGTGAAESISFFATGGAVCGDLTTLLSRLTSARAGYLDNLNVGGPVASHADIAATATASALSSVATDAAAAKTAAQAVQAKLPAGGALIGDATITNQTSAATTLSAINSKTTNLPAQPAATGDAMTLTSGERTATATVVNTTLTSAHGTGSWQQGTGGGGGGTGSGAYTWTVTVTDGTNPIEGASVRYTQGVQSYVGTTDVNGQVAFSIDAATWTVSITKLGYSFTPTTEVVSGSGTPVDPYAMTAVVIPASTVPGMCSCVATLEDLNGLVANATFEYRAVDGSAAGQVIDCGIKTSPASDVNGQVVVNIPQGWTIESRFQSGKWVQATIPSNAGPFTLPKLKGLRS